MGKKLASWYGWLNVIAGFLLLAAMVTTKNYIEFMIVCGCTIPQLINLQFFVDKGMDVLIKIE